jgi:hypothetical protein
VTFLLSFLGKEHQHLVLECLLYWKDFKKNVWCYMLRWELWNLLDLDFAYFHNNLWSFLSKFKWNILIEWNWSCLCVWISAVDFRHCEGNFCSIFVFPVPKLSLVMSNYFWMNVQLNAMIGFVLLHFWCWRLNPGPCTC